MDYKELTGRLPKDFVKAVAMFCRPYIPITKEEHLELLDKTTSDFILYEDKVCTFGFADGGAALMPIESKKAEDILKRGFAK